MLGLLGPARAGSSSMLSTSMSSSSTSLAAEPLRSLAWVIYAIKILGQESCEHETNRRQFHSVLLFVFHSRLILEEVIFDEESTVTAMGWATAEL